MVKLFVWDFHGTLEKGNEQAVLEITNDVLKKFGFARRMTGAESEFLYGRKWNEYFSFLLPGEPEETCRALATACREVARAHPEILTRNIMPNDHAHTVLEAIDGKHIQIAISNTTPTGIDMYLKAVNMKRFFPDGCAFGVVHPSFSGSRTKVEALKEFLNGREFENIVAIGDSAHDMIGSVNYLYAHPDRKHRDCEAHYRINDLREVLKEL
ncbi:HAD hydrolase-like protein [bacterium]|nr:HAD hydrolase-like protein [bacterium]